MGTTSRIPPGGIFRDPDFDFSTRIALGMVASGVSDVGLVLAALDRVTDGDAQSWFDAWSASGAALAAQGDTARASGHLHSARWAYLAASGAYAKAQDAVDGLAEQSVLNPTFAAHRKCWDAWIDAAEGRHVRVEIPYEGTTLPGYLLRPDATGVARPTLVMTNGSDGSLTDVYGSGATEALARGWNAFLYDGPGQQSLLFERGVPFRPDWEAVLTPVVDALIARSDVVPDALTGYGISQAGYWLPRALAFEHRLVAAVADPGVVDVSTSWTGFLPPEMIALLHGGKKAEFNGFMAQAGGDPAVERTFAFRSRPYGIDDPYDLFTEVGKYQLRDVAAQIRTPLLITDPQDEQFWPGQSRLLFDLLPGSKEIVEFTRAEGGNMHCEPMARVLTHLRMFDWLEDQLSKRG